MLPCPTVVELLPLVLPVTVRTFVLLLLLLERLPALLAVERLVVVVLTLLLGLVVVVVRLFTVLLLTVVLGFVVVVVVLCTEVECEALLLTAAFCLGAVATLRLPSAAALFDVDAGRRPCANAPVEIMVSPHASIKPITVL